ncbi:uncharacterized protein LOC126967523 isoform X3 [Leptidea sinapis]|uniref:uncharacterized protein LOC126967523 isoform X3 n=1 Tax=Leptidea sinapis TaxID=189913 RepID=UPI0021C4413A|nr:uncharacterized protein LOC126967523 isoform X3 [Leptidea sinapis]
MQKSSSFERINVPAAANVKNRRNKKTTRRSYSSKSRYLNRSPNRVAQHIYERYHIIIKPKVLRSSSLSDLSPQTSDFSLEHFKPSNVCVCQHSSNFCNSFGDAIDTYWSKYNEFMSWNIKGKKSKKKFDGMTPETYGSRYASDFLGYKNDPMSSCADNSSYSTDEVSDAQAKLAAFPFKQTPSGNLKVRSNQSSTVGVLLADPTQAKVKVKFEGNSDETGLDLDNVFEDDPQLQYGPKGNVHAPLVMQMPSPIDRNIKERTHSRNQNKGKDLDTLGYGQTGPIDWMRVQLPKKQDLFQEFYRRIHNYINTDCLIHIGQEKFRCHRIVLQVYSMFFVKNTQTELELPVQNVTPEAFQAIYEWMISCITESSKVLNRNNILELMCASQYLSIKDLEEQCWACITNEDIFNEDTAFYLYREARVKGMTHIMEVMIPRVRKFFIPLVASNDFLDLEPDEVMTFLRSNYVCVTSEIEILLSGVRWLKEDWSSRKRYTVDVMRCVRFGLISPWQLVDIKRNPDNAEILEVVNEPEVQQMVDDGLAYVIIKYWYGNSSKNYYHWIDVLGLTEPSERNWMGEEKNHVTYKEFLKYLELFTIPKDQMYQQMSMMPPRRNEDGPGSFRSKEDKMEMRRPNIEFPSPATIMGLSDREKFPGMYEFLETRQRSGKSPERTPMGSPPQLDSVHQAANIQNASPEVNKKSRQPINSCGLNEPPEKESEDGDTINSDVSSDTINTNVTATDRGKRNRGERRPSVAACYLAAATSALASTTKKGSSSPVRNLHTMSSTSYSVQGAGASPPSQYAAAFSSPQVSLFNESKESLARANMNKLSASILGPSNKKYIADGSLFNWDRETVLVFGGTDPHSPYGVAGNTGKDIYRFDPVSNSWESVGELPEPRHHHSVAFLRGRVFLVGGADPREDDLRGKSVVVSTVWSYEPVTRSWFSESGLAIPRKNFGLVVHKMALYAIGGQDKKGRVLRSVEKFDPKTGFWTEVKSMSVARMAVASVKYREYIWVAGGMTGEKKRPVCKIVECYNSKTNEWTMIHNLRFPRCFATLFSMNDRLYIVGGAGKVNDKDKTPSSVGAIDVWDWKQRQWNQETEMSIPRHGHALAYLGTQLIIIGGVTTIYMRALSNVESFCCERAAWIRGVANLPSPLSGHGAVTLPPASLM